MKSMRQHSRRFPAHRPDLDCCRFEEDGHFFGHLDGSVRGIADFRGWKLSAEKLEAVKSCSSFEFMKQHESRFDPALETLWEQDVLLKSFLRNGRAGEGSVTLDGKQIRRFDQIYADRLGKSGVSLP